jgi:flagellar biosynthesis/type III secretory pathway protein FliH
MKLSSSVIKEGLVTTAALAQVLEPVKPTTRCPRERRRQADCGLCDYLRKTYEDINDPLEVEGLISQTFAEARNQGFEAGYAEATRIVRAEAELQFEEMKKDVQTLMERILNAVDQFHVDAEPELVSLALEIGRKVIRQELRTNHDTVIGITRDALRRIPHSENIVIKVNPQDLNSHREHRDDFLRIMDGARRIDIVEDRRVPPGGVMIEAESTTVDARIETQMGAITESLTDPEPPGENQ